MPFHNTAETFWSKVDKSNGIDDCWPWIGYVNSNGYGIIHWQKHKIRAHRLAYTLHFNIDISDVPCVCHKCDNRICCNPNHLFTGTYGDNLRDMVAKGRHGLKGKKNPASPLSAETVQAIREMLKTCGHKRTAKVFGLHPSNVQAIMNGRTYKWVPIV